MKSTAVLLLSVSVAVASSVRSQELDLVRLGSASLAADRLIRTDSRPFFSNVRSFIVYAGRSTVFEAYYGGMTGDSLYHLQSQTKSVVSLLMGIAIDRGFVPGERELVGKYFPEYFDHTDSLKARLTIRDLLTMSAGFEWEEMIPQDDPNNDNMNMYRSNSYLHYVLSRPVTASPFTAFEYNSGCPMAVAGIIERASGMRLDEFAQEYLFGPLSIEQYYWIKDSTGLCHAGGGLYLTPPDVVKIGIVVMNHGKWDARQVVSRTWIDAMTRPYFPTGVDVSQYGYFWWIRDMSTPHGMTTRAVSAEGAGGQKLYLFPAHGLIVAFTERNYFTPQVGPMFIKESILPLLDQ